MPDLAATLEQALAASVTPAARRAAERLRDAYRSGAPLTTLAIADEESAAAYAAYRMPATAAAIGAALADRLPFPPAAHTDLGGGTGAAVWVVHDRWPAAASTVIDASPAALSLGRSLASRAGIGATWQQRRLGAGVVDLPPADLTTISYLLGELPEAEAWAVVGAAMDSSRALLVVEPGTPRGYAAALATRDRLRDAGWSLLAPCPHALDCPIVAPDWCHFSVRVQRSAAHRDLKSAALNYEDEKFAYVLAVAPGEVSEGESRARVLRHPIQRKGLVQFRVCTPEGLIDDVIISKRQGERYKKARDTEWGDPLPETSA